jgi:hypothetical protein
VALSSDTWPRTPVHPYEGPVGPKGFRRATIILCQLSDVLERPSSRERGPSLRGSVRQPLRPLPYD